MYLAMTTNERMNAGRYKHFHGKRGEIKSPFHKGVLQNLVDVAGITNIYSTRAGNFWIVDIKISLILGLYQQKCL